ncbi:MAG: bifunctional adenosylcobinamide kinase/adenosylcobinamide-phosphate guanylyltransferase, partial [Petrimonas sp.]|nr:bifunctional adenosylcobinamide kinase/adenosylcobinamide-phosphate guanylyltransferase [Petrimonas sp.]
MWTTIEEEKLLSRHDLSGRTVLMDCVTLWLTNIFHDNKYNRDISLEEAKAEWERFINQDFNLIAVSNEIGMGLHAPGETARHFTDLQGWMNQHIAKIADEVYFMVSGIPIQIK